MSRRAAIIEEEFDDDTDLPLPSHPLPSTTNGPLIQEIDIDDDQRHAGPASAPQSPFHAPPHAEHEFHPQVTDITPYKNWTCVYPIYIDAKRPYGTGQRRLSRENAVWWPLSKDIADASNALGLRTLHEVDKSHPRDWENPGRVRILWKKDGRLMNPVFKTKKLLLEAIAARIQRTKPASKPIPPFRSTAPAATPAAPTPTPGKGKQASAPAPKKQPVSKSKGRVAPTPPLPHPPLASRVSSYSPALASGMLVDAVKAGMAAQAQEAAAAPGTPGVPGQQTPGGMQKGKRKVVRVRG
ncbi:signal recognition particle, SRP19 subunit [Roridomyces roridus]|uniref:Signal recognition particle, SRP19 subunit n=1 Tax=Roridomyces roridus TaxID=1738132 RepID=A0AAD7C2E3_9AGAR|nr:signal recognition particle, SRP19 subunit [Roridomyces roridus]